MMTVAILLNVALSMIVVALLAVTMVFGLRLASREEDEGWGPGWRGPHPPRPRLGSRRPRRGDGSRRLRRTLGRDRPSSRAGQCLSSRAPTTGATRRPGS
jgi:hypothetical protein